jgi:DtxR family Mn-dependent transcriptional regulator
MLQNSSATVDKYLEAIFYIDAEGAVVRPGHLASWLAVSPPTVTEALGRLRRDGWISVETNRSVLLTEAGSTRATNLVRRHRILERWLTDVLGLDWASADEEADTLSSAISDRLIDRIDESLQRPLTCPHGNVIPGRRTPYGELRRLASVPAGSVATVRRISEVAEHEARDLLTLLATARICEGSVLSVVAPVEHERMSIVVADAAVEISLEASQLIWVELEERE